MKSLSVVVLLFTSSSVAQETNPPKHLYRAHGRLTAPSGLAARSIGGDFLRSTALARRLRVEDADAAAVVREYRSDHNGVTHLVYKQRFQGVDVENAEWTVNIDGEGQVINAGGSLVRGPADGVLAPDPLSAMRTLRAAAGAVNARLAERFAPLASSTPPDKGLRFAGGTFPGEIDALPVWWSERGRLRPAWKFGITDGDGLSRWAVVVDAATRSVLSKRASTWWQSGPRGLVFDKGSPQPNPTPGVALTAPPPIVERTLQPFTGDPVASPRGWVYGTETAGNNVIAGVNVLGSNCLAALDCLTRPRTSKAADGNFSFPLDVKGNPAQYPDASTANLFYWANRAHDWFYALGFNEAAGNFQQNNLDRGGVDGDPMIAYALFGAAAPGRAGVNNAFFTTALEGSDGSQAQIAFLLETANGFYYDNAQDAPTVVHEYAHGVTSRLVRSLNASFHGGSMGEGWSDFFAIEMLTPPGAPVDGAYPFSEYPDQVFGKGIRTRAYSTRFDVNPLTFAQLGRVYFMPEVHADGEIWFQALWEMRAALIKQFGETEGRRRARLLTMDGLKLTPPAPSMLDARDAILLADQVTFKGENQTAIWAGFAKRGMGVLAMSKSGNSVHIKPSHETPSARGAIAFYEDRYVIGESITLIVHDANITADSVRVQVLGTSGDVENINLRREGQVFLGALATDYTPVIGNSGALEVMAGDFITAFYNDYNAPGGTYLASATAPVQLDYAWELRAPTALRFTGEQSLGLAFTTYRPYELPWQFPYFGNSYKQIWVHNNGLLSFDFPTFAACPDTYGLWQTNGIAPLWMALATDGGAQAGEDVYVSLGPSAARPDWVTFRWAAETAPDYPGSRAEVVNFAATLYKDGRIVFQYGSGNRNLTAGSNWQGCEVSSPVVGLSNGHESFISPILTHDGKGTLENASTVVIDPPFSASTAPVVKLESPLADAKVKNVLTGAGIAYDPDPEGGIRDVEILIDGVGLGIASYGRARSDFCNVQRVQGCPNVGFTFSLPLDKNQIKPGAHTLQLRTSNIRGYFVDTPEKPLSFTVEAAEAAAPVSAIETPTAGQEVSGAMAVRGYVYSATDRLQNVDVLVDGVTVGRAAYTTTRADICGGLTPAPVNCPRIGFTYSLNTRTLPDGEHTLSIRVGDDQLRYSAELPGGVRFKVNNAAASAPPVGVLTAPAQGQRISGVMKVSGHAYAPAGTVVRVRLLVDGYPMQTLTYGSARAEACAALTGVRACPNIGFESDFDTRRLSNGPHFINILVEDDRGGATFFPQTFFSGVDVTVEN